MTPSVASHVSRSGAEPSNHRFFSDHRGIVDLELKGLFCSNLAPLAQPTFWDIRSSSSQLIQVYITELKAYLINHKNAEQIDHLAQARDDDLAEAIAQKNHRGHAACWIQMQNHQTPSKIWHTSRSTDNLATLSKSFKPIQDQTRPIKTN
jgi:hypothetical protein